MTTPRSLQIDLSATPYYHCVARCVRRAYLYGYDKESQKDFSHRKQWITDRIKHLSRVFFIETCAYAVMSNHYHLVLHVKNLDSKKASLDELLYRWHLVFPSQANKFQEELDTTAKDNPELIDKLTQKLQERLSDISWYMRCINEMVAVIANKEDNCKGRFWEGRFKSQALLDEGAILSAMVYVDLNPIRAGMAISPETSDFTSIQERIQSFLKNRNQPSDLMPFDSKENKIKTDSCNAIDFDLEDYLELVDQTGKIIREDKRGWIPESLPPLLERLELTSKGWLDMVSGIQRNFSYAIGRSVYLKEFIPSLAFRNTKQLDFVDQCYFDLENEAA